METINLMLSNRTSKAQFTAINALCPRLFLLLQLFAKRLAGATFGILKTNKTKQTLG
jgi:hypothetical protein